MALHMLRSISSKIVSSNFFAVTADECTNIANKEQFVVCIDRWMKLSQIMGMQMRNLALMKAFGLYCNLDHTPRTIGLRTVLPPCFNYYIQ